MRLGTVGTGWLNKKNTFLFFEGYCDLSERWRISPPSDALILSLYTEVDNFNYPPRNKLLFKYKLIQQSEQSENNPLSQEYFSFVESLRASSFWLDACHSRTPSYKSNSFLAAQAISYRDGEHGVLIRKIHERASINRSVASLRNMLGKVRSLAGRSSLFDDFLDTLINTPNDVFPELANIHYEVTENMDHWMCYPRNSRSQKYKRELFGDTLLFEIELKTILKSESSRGKEKKLLESYLRKFPASFSDYIKAHIARSKLGLVKSGFEGLGTLHFLELNYFDDGRGIEENIRNFSADIPVQYDLKSVIEDRISTREIDGSGLGFSNIVQATRDSFGFFYLRSGWESLSMSAHGEKTFAIDRHEKYFYGSALKILVPLAIDE